MINKKQRITILLLMMFMLFVSLSVVSANDNMSDTIDTFNEVQNVEILSNYNVNNEEILQQDTNNVSNNNNYNNQIEKESTKNNRNNDKLGTTVTVNSYAELVNAIETAKQSNEDNYIIQLNNGDYNATQNIIWGTGTGSLRNLTIEGNNITLDGKQTYQFMTVNSGYSLVLNNLVLSNYNATYGGAIFVSDGANLNVTNSQFINNSVGQYGGAICFAGVVSSSSISNNTFTDNNASHGGAIFFFGTVDSLNVSSNVFTSNSASQDGGGIYFDGIVSNSSILSNNFTSNIASQSGGGIYFNGIVNSSSILNNNFINNHALEIGNAIFFYNMVDSSSISNNTFINNNASKAGTIGFYNTVNNSNISTNTFTNNSVSQFGGGIYFGAIVSNSSILSNNFMSNIASRGGGIYISTTLNSSFISNNVFTNNNADQGGGIYIVNALNSSISNNTFTNNNTGQAGGAIFFIGTVDSLNVSSNVFTNNSVSQLGGAILFYYTVKSSSISSNIFMNNNATGYGGAICFYNTTVNNTISNNNFTNNNASYGGAIFFIGTVDSLNVSSNVFTSNSASQDGGGIYFNNIVSNSYILSNNFTSNIVSRNGGGIYFVKTLNNSSILSNVFTNNIASQWGGAIFFASKVNKSNVSSNVFTNNSASLSGAIDFYNGTSNTYIQFNIFKYSTPVNFNNINNTNINLNSDDNYIPENASVNIDGTFVNMVNSSIAFNFVDKLNLTLNITNSTELFQENIYYVSLEYILINVTINPVDNILGVPNEPIQINITLNDDKGNNVIMGKITIYNSSNDTIGTGTVTDGVANVSIIFDNTYDGELIVIYTDDSDTYASANTSLSARIITGLNASLTTTNVSVEYGQNVIITAELKEDDEALSDKQLVLVIKNGEENITLNNTTNTNGIATFNYNNLLNVGEYDFVVILNDSVYVADNVTGTLNVTQVISNLTVDSVSTNILNNSIKIKATVSNVNTSGIVVNEGVVVFKINDTTTNVSVVNGIAELNITHNMLSGNYTINATYIDSKGNIKSSSYDDAILTVNGLEVSDYEELANLIDVFNKYTGNVDLVVILNGTNYTETRPIVYNGSNVLTILGNNKTIDANGKQFLTIAKGSTANILNLSVINAKGTRGAAIINNGVLNINDSLFKNNNAGSGGAIFVNDTANLNVTNSTFINNSASEGLAIYFIGNVSNSIVSGNTFINNSVYNSKLYSGVIYFYSSVSNSSVSDNTFTNSGVNGSAYYEGVIYFSSSVNDSSVSGNTFTNSSISRGVIYFSSSVSNSSVSGNTFTNNSISRGVIYFSSSVNDSSVSGNTFTNNSVNGSGNDKGVIYFSSSMSNSSVSDNTFTNNSVNGGGSYGGVIYFSNSVSNSSVSGNTFTNNSVNGGGSYRGVIYFSSSVNDSSVSDNTFTNNSVNNCERYNGVMYFSNSVSNSSVSGNTFTNNSVNGSGNDKGVIYFSSSMSNSSVSDNTFTNNSVNNCERYNGVIYFSSSMSNSSVSGNTFTNNSVNGGGSYGGVIYFYSSVNDSSVSGNTFTNNSVNGGGYHGGVIYFYSSVNDSSVSDNTFTNNSVNNGGRFNGVMYFFDTKSNTYIKFNVFMYNTPVNFININNTNIKLNQNDYYIPVNAGVNIDETTVNMVNSLIDFNLGDKLNLTLNITNSTSLFQENIYYVSIEPTWINVTINPVDNITGVTNESIQINITIKDDNGNNVTKGTVTIYNSSNDIVGVGNVTNGVSNVNISFNQNYNDTLTINYTDPSGVYGNASRNFSAYIISKANITTNNSTVEYGQDINITATLKYGEDVLDNKELTLILVNGNENITLTSTTNTSGIATFNYDNLLDVGSYDFVVVLNDSVYVADNVTGTLNVTQIQTTTSIGNVNVTTLNDTINITVNVTNKNDTGIIINEGIVNFTVNGTNSTVVNVTNGTATLIINNTMSSGEYNISVIYSDINNNINSSNASAILTVNKVTASLTTNTDVIVEYGLGSIMVELKYGEIPLNDKLLLLTVKTDETEVIILNDTTDVEGKVVFNLSTLNVGNYIFTVSLNDTVYNATDISGTLNVTQVETITSIDNVTVTTLNDTINITANITNKNEMGIVIDEGNVTFTVNNTNYVVDLVNGTATLMINQSMASGEYPITVVYNGNDNIKSSSNDSAVLIVNKIGANLTVDNLTIEYGLNGTINAELKFNDEAIKNKELTLVIENGESNITLISTTNEYGIATFNYTENLDVNVYNFTVSFTDTLYNDTNDTGNINVTQIKTDISVDNVVVNILNDTFSIVANITNNNTNGIPINNGTVMFTIGNNTPQLVNIINSSAVLNITNTMLTGNYSINVTYSSGTDNIADSEYNNAVLVVNRLEVSDYEELASLISTLNGYTGSVDLVVILNGTNYTETRSIVYSGSKVLTILGNNQTIDANSMQFLTITKGSTVNILNLSVINANGTNGAAIINNGVLNINDSLFKNNNATMYGGAIYNTGNITINNVSFIENNVIGDSSEFNYGGGAIYSTGMLNVNNSSFTNNRANNNKEAPDITGGYGGAISTSIDADVIITESVFKDNVARVGGAIYTTSNEISDIDGLKLADNEKENIITNNNFTNNKALIAFTIATDKNAIVEISDVMIDDVDINDAIITENESIFTITNYDNLIKLISNIDQYQSDKITITLNDGNYTETEPIKVTSNKTIIIDGNNQTIDANNNQFLNISADSTVVVKNLIVINSILDNGATIVNNGNLTIIDSIIKNNTVTSIIDNTGNLEVTHSIIADNTVDNIISNTGTLKLNSNFIENNTQNIIISDNNVTNDVSAIILDINNIDAIITKMSQINITLNSSIEGITIRSGIVKLLDGDSNILATANVTRDATAVINYNFTTISNQTYTIVYEGFKVYNDAISNEFNISVQDIESVITAHNITGLTGENITLNVKVVDKNDNNINKGTIKVYDSENNLISNTNVTNGSANITLTFNQSYNDILTLVFDSIDEYSYSESIINAHIKIKTSIPKMDDVQVKYGANTTLIALIITDDDVLIDNVNLSLIIDDENISTASVVSGIIVFNYTANLSVGNYSYTILFGGDDNYLASNTTAKLEITQANSQIKSRNINTKVGEDITITANITNSYFTINEGKVRFTINETLTEDVDVVNGVAQYNITGGLPTGTYNISVEYLGTTNITTSTTSANVVVDKRDVQIIVESDLVNPTVGDENRLHIIVSSDDEIVEGKVNLTIGGNTVTLDVTNGTVDYSYDVTSAGNESIVVSFIGDDTYNTNSSIVEVEVAKAVTTVKVQTVSTTLNTTVLLNASVTSENNTVNEGTVTFYVNDTLVGTVSVANGEATIQYITRNIGDSIIKAVYNGSNNYNVSEGTNMLVVTRVTPTVTLNPIQTIVGENTTIQVYVFANGLSVNDGVVTINSSVLNATANVTDGVATITTRINNIYNGTLNVKYSNSTVFDDANSITTLLVTKASTTITANNIIGKVNTQTILNVNVTSNGVVNGGNVIVYDANGNLLATKTVTDGISNIALGAGVFNSAYDSVLIVNYMGNDNFESGVTVVRANISRLNASINTVRATTASVGSNINISVNIINENKNNVTTGYVEFIYNNTVLGTVNVARGNASIITKFTNTNNSVRINYYGEDKYTNTNKTIIVNATKLNSTVRVGAVKARVGDNITLTANVTDSAGNKVSYGTVYFRINGTNIRYSNGTVVTASVVNGTATTIFTVPSSWTANTTHLSAYYNGVTNTSSAISSNTTVNITTRPVNVTFFTDSNSYYTGDTINVRVIITDNNALVNGGTVTFKFNGVTLKYANGSAVQVAVKDGVASISYTLPSNIGAGNHTFNIVFGGGIYQRYEATTKISVLKTDVHVEVSPIIATSKTTTISARVYDGHNSAIRGTTKVSIKIAGSTFVSNANITNGVISFTVNTNFATGLYDVSISVGENSYYKGTKIETKLLKT